MGVNGGGRVTVHVEVEVGLIPPSGAKLTAINPKQ